MEFNYLDEASGGGGDYFFDLDPTNNYNLPSFGLNETIVIVIEGQLPDKPNVIIDGFWNFPTIEYVGPAGGPHGLPGPTDPCVGGAGDKVNWSFIAEREGSSNSMYVPKDAHGNVLQQSGPTIGSGFDLGAHDEADLVKMGITGPLLDKLRPYLTLHGTNADNYVASHPLTLTSYDTQYVNAAAHGEALTRLVKMYDQDTGREGAFWALPEEAQTAIASISFQYGYLNSNLVVPKNPVAAQFWYDVTHNQWSTAVTDLRSFGDIYPTRRGIEANYLNAGIILGHVTNGSPC